MNIVKRIIKKRRLSLASGDPSSRLTSREKQVLMLICQELSPNQISTKLQISEKTFFNHRASILIKTNAKSNVGLFRYALQVGYCELSE